MKLQTLFILVTLTIVSCTNHPEETMKDTVNIKELDIKQENGYPWSKDITELAIQAIHRSIRNVQTGNQDDKNFPSDPYYFTFSEDEIKRLRIAGFTTSTKPSNIYWISFEPTSEIEMSGPSIVVQINIQTKEVIQVYMSPDA